MIKYVYHVILNYIDEKVIVKQTIICLNLIQKQEKIS